MPYIVLIEQIVIIILHSPLSICYIQAYCMPAFMRTAWMHYMYACHAHMHFMHTLNSIHIAYMSCIMHNRIMLQQSGTCVHYMYVCFTCMHVLQLRMTVWHRILNTILHNILHDGTRYTTILFDMYVFNILVSIWTCVCAYMACIQTCTYIGACTAYILYVHGQVLKTLK